MRLNPKGFTSVAVAVLFVLVGCWRFASDVVLDARSKDPQYLAWLATSPLRYVVRGPSDGTLLGDLNTQWFKVLSIPCAMAFVYLWHRQRLGSLRAGAAHFGQRWVRALWVGVFFVAFTLIEVEKQFQVFVWLGMKTAPMQPGESFWLNHLAHVISATLAWLLVARLSFQPVFGDDLPPLPPRPPRRPPRVTPAPGAPEAPPAAS